MNEGGHQLSQLGCRKERCASVTTAVVEAGDEAGQGRRPLGSKEKAGGSVSRPRVICTP